MNKLTMIQKLREREALTFEELSRVAAEHRLDPVRKLQEIRVLVGKLELIADGILFFSED